MLSRLLLFGISFLATVSLSGQNLLANGSFEEINRCTEFNATCAPEAWFRIPPSEINVGTRKYPKQYAGKQAELVVVDNAQHQNYRVFLYSMLLCPLDKDQPYRLQMHLNPLLDKNYKLGVLFSETEPVSGEDKVVDWEPGVTLQSADEVSKNKKTNWRQLEYTFTATGKEKFILFGNFEKAVGTDLAARATNNLGDIIYLIDDVSLEAKNGEKPVCADYQKTKGQLYAQNFRHTDHKRVSILPPLRAIDTIPNFAKPTVSAPDAPKAIKFEIPDIAFEFDRFLLKDTYKQELCKLTAAIAEIKPIKIEIIGHTDNLGSDDYNQKLSKNRAMQVYQFLSKHMSIEGIRFEILGKGETAPIATNETAAGRSKNRRVDILVIQ